MRPVIRLRFAMASAEERPCFEVRQTSQRLRAAECWLWRTWSLTIPPKKPAATELDRLLDAFRRRLLENEVDFELGASTHAIEGEIGRGDEVVIQLDGYQERARAALVAGLLTDLRFEHLKKRQADDISWRYAYACESAPEATDPVEIVWSNAVEPEKRVCWFWIPQMTLPGPIEFSGVTLAPADSHTPPERLQEKIDSGAVIGVHCEGTNPSNMRERALSVAEVFLRRLRVALDEEQWVLQQQLLFEISDIHWFESGGSGFRRAPGLVIPIDIDTAQSDRARDQPLLNLPIVPASEVQEQLEIAIGWVDRATFSTDLVVSTLFRFFALEALFTKRKEKKGLKRIIARRCATLSREVGSGYLNPLPIPHLYDQVRSQAVHGEEPHELTEKSARFVKALTQKALLEYLEFSLTKGFQHRWEMLNALDESKHRPSLIAGLKRHDPMTWQDKGE